jgi:homoserine dehydrogenase
MSAEALPLAASESPPRAAHGAVNSPERDDAPDLGTKVVLLGTGNVGNAVLARLRAWEGTPLARQLHLLQIANTRSVLRRALNDGRWREVPLANASALDVARVLGTQGTRIVVDATASEDVAERHALWLAQGIHVVTACKLGQGDGLARWQAIRNAQRIGGARYGDSATVGAGLPLLRTIRALQRGGDRILAVAGVLSGSLAWLLHHYDGLRPFSGFVRQAREAGYTEPDPRDDLSGEDVRRKLLILARAAGFEWEHDAVAVASLLTPALQDAAPASVDHALASLDAPMRDGFAVADKRGERLRFIARLEHGQARVGLELLPADHLLAGGSGTDNRVAIWSDRYREQPLLIQGPGAGAEVTAAALLDDVLEIAVDARGP